MFVGENSDGVTPGAFALVLNCTCCYLTLADQLKLHYLRQLNIQISNLNENGAHRE